MKLDSTTNKDEHLTQHYLTTTAHKNLHQSLAY